MIKAVVFDMDGLMFDTEKIGIRTWNTLSEELGYPKLHNLIYKCFGTNHNFKRKYFAEVLGEDFPYDLFCKREVEVTKIRNLGKKSLKEVLDKVADLGLTFKE